jgi:branched-subunit amino acid ABC-type transport system permease component
VFFHARLCRRGNGRCTPHCATGAAIAVASLLLLIVADWNLGIDLRPIYLAIPVLPALLAAAIGAASSAIVWRFAVRPLRSEQERLFRKFE